MVVIEVTILSSYHFSEFLDWQVKRATVNMLYMLNVIKHYKYRISLTRKNVQFMITRAHTQVYKVYTHTDIHLHIFTHTLEERCIFKRRRVKADERSASFKASRSTPRCIYWSPTAAVKIEKCLQIHTHLTVIMTEVPRLVISAHVGGCSYVHMHQPENVWSMCGESISVVFWMVEDSRQQSRTAGTRAYSFYCSMIKPRAFCIHVQHQEWKSAWRAFCCFIVLWVQISADGDQSQKNLAGLMPQITHFQPVCTVCVCMGVPLHIAKRLMWLDPLLISILNLEDFKTLRHSMVC